MRAYFCCIQLENLKIWLSGVKINSINKREAPPLFIFRQKKIVQVFIPGEMKSSQCFFAALDGLIFQFYIKYFSPEKLPARETI